MRKSYRFISVVFLAPVSILFAAVVPHIGFVYPAGGLPGTTFTVTIGGQHLRDMAGINISGVPVEFQQTDYLRIYDRQEASSLRRRKEVLEAKIAEETDEQLRQYMQKQVELLEPEIAMVKGTAMEDKRNPAMAAKKQFNPQIAERVALEITLPESVPPGDYDFRVITTNGLSNPFLFQIGQLPEITEKEPNNLVTAPDRLPVFPVLLNGQIMPGDVDCFRFSARKGQTLVFRTDARSLVPYLADAVPGWFQAVLTLYDAKGNEVAYNDDYFLNPDPVLIYSVPEDGDYIFSIRDSIYRGREDFVYRISIGEIPFIERISPLGGTANTEVDVYLHGVNLPSKTLKIKTADNAPDTQPVRIEKQGIFSNSRIFSVSPLPDKEETEPNNLFAQAMAVDNSTVINGRIEKPGDQDWFCFEGRQGQHKTVEVSARRLGSPLDARLVLMDARQQVLASSDDAEDKTTGLITHHADARIDFKLPGKGTYFVRLDDLQNKGGDEYAYRLLIGDEQQDFQLRVVPASLRIPKGGTAVVTVHAIRTGGFDGEIQLSVVDEPLGIELQRALIPEGVDSAQIIIAAAKDAKQQMMELEIKGTADCGRIVRRRALPAEDMMQAFAYRHLVTAQKLLVQISEPDPVTVVLKLPSGGVIQARPGSEITLNASVITNTKLQGGIKLALTDPPEWLTLGTATIAQPGSAKNVVLKVNPNAEPGDIANVLLTGSARIAKSAQEPGFNPVLKNLNNKTVDFTIDAISIKIIN